MKDDLTLTTYQIYLILLGYLKTHENVGLEPMLTELYRRAELNFEALNK